MGTGREEVEEVVDEVLSRVTWGRVLREGLAIVGACGMNHNG